MYGKTMLDVPWFYSPNTFKMIRLSPVKIIEASPRDFRLASTRGCVILFEHFEALNTHTDS